jgi:hypothetical protein
VPSRRNGILKRQRRVEVVGRRDAVASEEVFKDYVVRLVAEHALYWKLELASAKPE